MRCENCGTELYIGQRFCRNCGRPTDKISEENRPTQMMPPLADEAGGRGANTAPTSRPETSPVYTQPNYTPPQQNYSPPYYQPIAPPHPMPPYSPPRSRSPWGWILALVGIGLFGLVMLGVLIGSNAFRRNVPRRPSPPPAETLEAVGPVISHGETKLFPLAAGAKFAIENVSGKITVTGWDEPSAQVHIAKSGGSEQERNRVRVTYTGDPNGMTLKTVPASGSNRVQVEYEIKLPRNIAQLIINGVSSAIELSDVNGKISVETASGSIEVTDASGEISVSSKSGDLRLDQVRGKISAAAASGSIDITDVVGSVKAATASGDISAAFDGVAPGEPLQFASASGDIELQFNTDVNVDLSAQTVSGDIEVEDALGITVEKGVVGRNARGKIGSGGQPLDMKTVSGSIKISKQN